MTSGIESLRDNVYIQGLIERMFDYDQEITQVESEIFNRPDRMDVVFNYIDLSFQLLPASSDEAYTKHAKYPHILLKYYDVKSSLNMSHSSKIIDVFRYWIWKDPYLAKYLDQQTDGIDKSQNIETAQLNTPIAPQPASMEVDTQSKLDKLVSKNPAVSEDGQKILAEFMDWQATGPTYSFCELRNELCKKLFLYGLPYTCKESKKDWLDGSIEKLNVDYNKQPSTLDELLAVDAESYDCFNFHRSMSFEAINKETRSIDRKAHMFWEFPALVSKINNFIDSISNSEETRRKLMMTADTKDAKTFFSIKKH